MTLNDWLKKKGLSKSQFALQMGLTERAVRMWVDGDRIPAKDRMQEIFEATGGKVKPNDFYSLKL